jgi:hypothetical protein
MNGLLYVTYIYIYFATQVVSKQFIKFVHNLARKFVVLELLLCISSSFTSYPSPKSNNVKIGAPPFFNGIGALLMVLIEIVLKGYVSTLPINKSEYFIKCSTIAFLSF